tara:strand:+ start:400 stop:1101 length:702 start_codon:yes stop_codon:yes gene_type:complete
MTTKIATVTKISKTTLNILKNFSTINSNILVRPGNVLKTISPVKNVMSESVVAEDFDVEFGIWDLNKFLGTVSLFIDPDFEFNDKYVLIRDDSRKSEVKYYYSEPRLLTTVNKSIEMPDPVVKFDLTESHFTELQRASSVLQLPDLVLRNDGSSLELSVIDKSDPSSNHYSIEVGELPTSDNNFEFYFKVENLKMISGNYEVSISDKFISNFKKDNQDLNYWIALESDSNYDG